MQWFVIKWRHVSVSAVVKKSLHAGLKYILLIVLKGSTFTWNWLLLPWSITTCIEVKNSWLWVQLLHRDLWQLTKQEESKVSLVAAVWFLSKLLTRVGQFLSKLKEKETALDGQVHPNSHLRNVNDPFQTIGKEEWLRGVILWLWLRNGIPGSGSNQMFDLPEGMCCFPDKCGLPVIRVYWRLYLTPCVCTAVDVV